MQAAERALVDDDNNNLWTLYGTALHHYSLARLESAADAKDGTIGDEGLGGLLHQAALIGRRGNEWVNVQRRLGQVEGWLKKGLNGVSAETHTQVTTDLYAVDLPSNTPRLAQRARTLIEKLAVKLDAIGDAGSADRYRTWLNFVSRPAQSKPAPLPQRSEVETIGTEAENERALQLQITQAISSGQWGVAQELIIELNKLNGQTLNLDTEA